MAESLGQGTGKMASSVRFDAESHRFTVESDRLVGSWTGPVGTLDPASAYRAALESPPGFPPFRQAMVPGDRLTIALDPSIPGRETLLEAIGESAAAAGVEREAIAILGTTTAPEGCGPWIAHDPKNESERAYLASTGQGHRVYLNRLLTDADVVLPVGRLGYDATLGYRGPWSVIYPGLSDEAARAAYRSHAVEAPPDRSRDRPSLVESREIAWLLGCPFLLGAVPGASGTLHEVISGEPNEVDRLGKEAVDRAWTFAADSRAELVIAGVGEPGLPADFEAVALGLESALRLVRRGGKIVLLSRAVAEFGPALERLGSSNNPGTDGLEAIAKARESADYAVARSIARAVAWADCYLLSRIDEDRAQDLGFIPLGRPDEAQRLIALADSVTLVSQADQTRALTNT